MINRRIVKYFILIVVVSIMLVITISYRYYPVNIINKSMGVNFSLLSTKVENWRDTIGLFGGDVSGVFHVSRKDYDLNIQKCKKFSNSPVNSAISINSNFGGQQVLGHIECVLHKNKIESENEYLLFYKSESGCCTIKYIAHIN